MIPTACSHPGARFGLTSLPGHLRGGAPNDSTPSAATILMTNVNGNAGASLKAPEPYDPNMTEREFSLPGTDAKPDTFAIGDMPAKKCPYPAHGKGLVFYAVSVLP